MEHKDAPSTRVIGIADIMLTIKAYAKINLYLDIISRYPDGYHKIESVMQSISLHDLIVVSQAPTIDVSCTHEELCGQDNLAYHAAILLRQRMGLRAGATVTIDKRIPVAAGLAGGSADAAATLTGLNVLWELNLSIDQLQELGQELGADVPFCLAGGTMLAEGRGELLQPLNPLPDTTIVLITPPIPVSTAEVYQAFDREHIAPLNRKKEILDALDTGDPNRLAGSLGNLLESIALKRYPKILESKQRALASGGVGALMSGSGPSIFVICGDEHVASRVVETMRAYDPSSFVEIVKPVTRGVEIL
ncbi:MAG TPA: 4-(cytidine 5'-diphospho)-2-C-methyl-D-erythritol kinase [Anaerolineae bacterium]|jgi:4-diphosphocytidyl-2-C-methyl-D-erythritol kinase|nr:4-(cytidine 5'-diphospho)-2-C-methyl-D-erythritol kinase [Anaerolineae bacterium]